MNGSTGLAGIKILELTTGVSAAYCGRQFALWGADVAVLADTQEFRLELQNPMLWHYVAANKRLVRWNVSYSDLIDMVGKADVFITDHDEMGFAKLGVKLKDLQTACSSTIFVTLSAFGATGPFKGLAASNLDVEAMSGYADMNGKPDAAPLPAPGHIVPLMAGVSAFVAAISALYQRESTGISQHIDAAENEALSAILPFLQSEYLGIRLRRKGGPLGVRLLPTKDGHVSMMVGHPLEIKGIKAVLNIPEKDWPEDFFQMPFQTDKNAEYLSRYTKMLTTSELVSGLLSAGVACGKVNSPQDLLDDPHLASRGFFNDMEIAGLGTVQIPGAAAKMSRTKPVTPEAIHGQDDQIDFEQLAWTATSIDTTGLALEQNSLPPPLTGVRILDVTQAWIGPFASMLLAHLGADVIKIESHKRPDVWRQLAVNPKPVMQVKAEEVNSSPNYNSVNRNKRSLCLDLTTDQGRSLFQSLALDANVVMDNYTPAVMGRFGLDAPSLHAVNDSLVVSSFSGFGKTGPMSEYKANGTTIEAIAGWDYFHRYESGDPMLMGFYQADAICGYQMAACTLVALFHQKRTGEGQAVDGSMMEAAIGFVGDILLHAQLGDKNNPSERSYAPRGFYPTKGDKKWLALSIENDEQWQRFLCVADHPSFCQKEFASNESRIINRSLLNSAIAQWSRNFSSPDLMDKLQAQNICATTVRSMHEALECEHLEHRGWFQALSHPDVGSHRYNGAPWHFRNAESKDQQPSPRLGQHSREILRELGKSESQIDELFQNEISGVVVAETE